MTGSLPAASEITDSFTLDASTRQPGGLLNGTPAGTDGPRWAASETYRFDGSASDTGIAVSERFGSAHVPVPADHTRLQSNLDVKVTADHVGWIAIGFGPSGNTQDTSFTGGLFLYLDSKGDSQIRANGLKIKLVIKNIPDFRPDALNHLQLVYDRVQNSVSARINETIVAENVPLPDFTPEIFFACFSNYGTNTRSRIDNFLLKIDTGELTLAANPADSYRILFIGDSITQSRAQVVPGWTITAGMAASSPDKDYVSLVCDGVAEKLGGKVTRKVIADQGGKVAGYTGRTPQYRAFSPHLAIIQFGENERGTAAQFEHDYEALLKDIASLDPKPAIICTGIWAPHGKYPYVGRNAEMEAVVQKLASAYGAAYAPVGAYAADSTCKGYGDSDGVRWHPNDAGMKGYAKEILARWNAPAAKN